MIWCLINDQVINLAYVRKIQVFGSKLFFGFGNYDEAWVAFKNDEEARRAFENITGRLCLIEGSQFISLPESK